MKRKFLKILPILIFLLASCTGTSGSSVISSSQSGESSKVETSSAIELSSGKISSSSASSEPSSSKEVVSKIFEVKKSELVSVFYTNEKMSLSSVSQTANYFILDQDQRIVYTACHIYYDFGTKLKSYQSPMYESLVPSMFSSDSVIVPQGMMGYEINTDSYASLMRSISDNMITLNEAKDHTSPTVTNWNSKDNKFIKDNMGIKLVEDSSMKTRNETPFRLSSIYDNFDSNGYSAYIMEAPYNDNYIISCDEATLRVEDDNQLPLRPIKDNTYSLKKGQRVIVELKGNSLSMFNLKVKPIKHEVELPYEVLENPSLDSYDTEGKTGTSPYKNPLISAVKRNDGRGLYVNCNNPEALYEDCLNTVLTGQDVTDKEVFFTYEHNTKISKAYYYAYRVTNTGDKDIFITVKNMGNQLEGDGAWLGEDEWTQFYNLSFRTKGINKFTDSQKKNFKAYIGFSNTCEAEKRQPITYRVPKGKYIYVLGGTTKDAYRNINVFNTADKLVTKSLSGCSNGAVIFEVSGGKAFGQFMAYDSNDASSINSTDYILKQKQYGYCTTISTPEGSKDVGLQYSGYDNCHGVVDTNIEMVFNDSTKAGSLPVKYKNPYYSTSTTGTPYELVTGVKAKIYSSTDTWVTHINPASTPEAVGTDMTKYITTDHKTGKDIVIEPERYDGTGSVANIGNWMVDYIDTFTLVNQGDTERTFTYSMSHSGVILAFVRDENGLVDEKAYPVSYQTKIAASKYGDAISEEFSYSVKVPPHSVIRFSVDYNLCANSNGYISHTCKLK